MDFTSPKTPDKNDPLAEFLLAIHEYCSQPLEKKGTEDAANNPDPGNLVLNQNMIKAGLVNILLHYLPQLQNKVAEFDAFIKQYSGDGLVNQTAQLATKREKYAKEIENLEKLLSNTDAFERKVQWVITSYEIGFQIGVRTYLQTI
jgi:hypothetical protein